MATKPKVPFKRFPLKKQKIEAYTPPKDKQEGTDIRNRGYFPGSNFTADEREWLRAVEKLQKRTGRKFLSHVDYQRLAVSLGYLLPPKATANPTEDRQ